MALQKQQISLPLISGADTKIDPTISQNYQDMVNVVFTGNTTAKKMKGYDLVASLPTNEYYSSIFTRGNDLIAQTNNGSYRLSTASNTFSKISGIGSSSIDSTINYGEIFSSSLNFNLMISFYNNNDISYLKYTFLNKDGSIFQTIEEVISVYSLTWSSQIDVFKHMLVSPRYVNGSTFTDSYDEFFVFAVSSLSAYKIRRFKYDSGSGLFIQSDATPTGVVANYSLTSVDMYCDPSPTILSAQHAPPIFIAIQDGGLGYGFQNSLAAFTVANLIPEVQQVTPPGGGTISGSFQLHPRAIGSFRLTMYNSLDVAHIENFSYTDPLTTLASKNVTNISKNTVFTDIFYPCQICCYPTSDTAMVYFQYKMVDTAITGMTYGALPAFFYGLSSIPNMKISGKGLLPISRIFQDGNFYYAHFIQQVGLNCINYVINISNGSIAGTFGYSKAIQNNAINGSGTTVAGTTAIYAWNSISGDATYSLHNAYKNNNSWTLCTRDILPATIDKYATTRSYNFYPESKTTNTCYEVGNKSSIFNGQPSYYDGVSFSELGINCAPVLLGISEINTGGVYLPTASNWQIVAVYSWKDTTGDVFYSDISNIIGLGVNIQTVGVTYYNINVIPTSISEKKGMNIEIYAKNSGDQFHLVATAPANSTVISFKSYTNTNIKYLYATGTFAAGGDYPTSPITDCIASAIYEDRIFAISRDNPSSIFYSQKKIQGYGPEFNQDIFYLDVYDKRGVYEDKLTGLMAMDGRLFIFKERSILFIAGSGPSRANTQDDFGTPQLITTDVGCISAKSLVLSPSGIMFMSDKGIYLLDRSLKVSYIGSSVERFNSNTITSAMLLEKVNEVRFGTFEGEVLVYNYYSNAWSWFTNLPSCGACIWKGQYTLLLSSGKVYKESLIHNKIIEGTSHTAIIQKISSPWIRPHEIQGFGRVFETFLIGKFKSLHNVKVSFYYDYEDYASDVYTLIPLASSQYNITSRPTNGDLEKGIATDGVYQIKVDMIRKLCQSFRVVIEDIPLDISNNTGESFALSNIAVSIGVKKAFAEIPGSKTY
jgi:hypothetical protein